MLKRITLVFLLLLSLMCVSAGAVTYNVQGSAGKIEQEGTSSVWTGITVNSSNLMNISTSGQTLTSLVYPDYSSYINMLSPYCDPHGEFSYPGADMVEQVDGEYAVIPDTNQGGRVARVQVLADYGSGNYNDGSWIKWFELESTQISAAPVQNLGYMLATNSGYLSNTGLVTLSNGSPVTVTKTVGTKGVNVKLSNLSGYNGLHIKSEEVVAPFRPGSSNMYYYYFWRAGATYDDMIKSMQVPGVGRGTLAVVLACPEVVDVQKPISYTPYVTTQLSYTQPTNSKI